ncbi:MAG TPA: hypothetical protein ENJ01_08505 [Gammaproteobacteria bacterium]|nr:hypothetical protein [Gammaproteobacteria bacterium]
MRDYDNIPVLEWHDGAGLVHAMAQVKLAEPVIIRFPEDFNLDIDANSCGCKAGNSAVHHVDCHAHNVLRILAELNALPSLAKLGEIAHEAGQLVDVEEGAHRIIIHD